MKSFRDEMLSLKKATESDVVQISDSAKARPGPSNQPDPIPTLTSIPRASDHLDVQPMDTDFYGSPLPPKSSQNVKSEHASKQSDIESDHSEHHSNSESPKKRILKQKSILRKGSTRHGQNIILSRLLQRNMSPLPQLESLLNLNIRFLRNLNTRTPQIQSFIGR